MHARCVICSDLFDFIQDIAATLCGHIFHSVCLAQWLEQSKTCPQCRSKITNNKIIHKLYFDTEHRSEDGEDDGNTNLQLINQVESCKADLAASNKEKLELHKKIEQYEESIRLLIVEKQSVQTALLEYKDNCRVFKNELKNMQQIKSDNVTMKSELIEVKKKMQSFQNLKAVMDDATKGAWELIGTCQQKPPVDEVLKWYYLVKKELIKSDNERKKLKHELDYLQKDKKKMEQKVIENEARADELEKELKFIESERENVTCNCNSGTSNSPLLISNSQTFKTPFLSSPTVGHRRNSNTEEWIQLSPEILPDKSTKRAKNKRDNLAVRGGLRITSKRHMSDSTVPPRLKSKEFHFNGLGGCSKYETPFPIPKAKVPKLSSLDNYITLD